MPARRLVVGRHPLHATDFCAVDDVHGTLGRLDGPPLSELDFAACTVEVDVVAVQVGRSERLRVDAVDDDVEVGVGRVVVNGHDVLVVGEVERAAGMPASGEGLLG